MAFPLEMSRIRVAEQKLGRQFPPAFVARMTSDNAGEVIIDGEVWELHPFHDPARQIATSYDICAATGQAEQWPHFPPGAVAFATNGCGDALVFMPKVGEPALLSDAVFMWSHESGEADWVADDFGDLG